MKSFSCIILAINASTALVDSQNEEIPISHGVTPVRIIGEVQDGTPPAPEPPKPGFMVPQKDILNTTVHEQDGRILVLEYT